MGDRMVAPHGDCESAAASVVGRFVRSAKARRFGPPGREKLGWPGVQHEARAERLVLSNPTVRICVGETE